ncbi:hypothetical protein DFP72DRAFT_1045382 [Ephemerocybe angulata]|uniref:Retrotransposon gag domain-containing protein n=1 Tax=Ephemerocybe angulata TaxID=980116 RepID=A0A8H6HYM0_9AGAR|nr:hypothetical protein DFP72DRAFT_1045382 [Tulosesus angulatus]
MSSKIIPVFNGPTTANALKIWLGQCEDGFDNYQDTHKDATLSPKTRIRLTGAALLEPAMAEWWAAGRKEYLDLATWDAFVAKLKERFLPVGWKMDVLERFYQCEQGKRDFRVFAAELAQCHGALPSNTISTSVYKYHLLYFSHPQLYLRLRALQSFDIDSSTLSVDQLTALMGHQWDSLVADSAPRSSRTTTSSASVPLRISSVPSVPVSQARSSSSTPPLSDAERKTLSDANGCFNCRRKPGDPDWTPHFRRTCPGNPAISAPPGPDYVAPSVTVVGAALAGMAIRDEDTSDEESEVEDQLEWGESDDDPLS